MSSEDAGVGDGSGERELRIAKLTLLARRAPLNAAATALNCLLLGALLYRSAPRAGLLAWVLLSTAGAAWMSGYDPGLLERFEAREVLHKPFSPEQLEQAVAKALSEPPMAPVEMPALSTPPT